MYAVIAAGSLAGVDVQAVPAGTIIDLAQDILMT
jgi:hypothetical protein